MLLSLQILGNLTLHHTPQSTHSFPLLFFKLINSFKTLSSFIIMSSLAIFFLFCLSLHACNARRLSLVAEEIGNQVDFLAKDIKKLNPHELEMMRPSIPKELKAQELQVGDLGRRIHDNWIGANAMIVKQTLLGSFLKAKEAVAKAVSSGHEVNYVIFSGVDHLENMENIQGSFKRERRSMLGNSAGDTEEAFDSKEKDNVGDIDVMDYAQPHRKPPIHNEKS